MEVARLTLKTLPESIDSIGCISNEWKSRIIEIFKTALNPDLVNLSARDINKAMGLVNGEKALNDNDDYYNGRFTESFAETRAKAAHNAALTANDETSEDKNSVEDNISNTGSENVDDSESTEE